MAMAAVTKKLSFGITASTTYENPFLLARRFTTLDHLSKGRVAWNAVTLLVFLLLRKQCSFFDLVLGTLS